MGTELSDSPRLEALASGTETSKSNIAHQWTGVALMNILPKMQLQHLWNKSRHSDIVPTCF